MKCIECDSPNTNKRGLFELSNGSVKQRYKCKDCSCAFSVSIDDQTDDMFEDEIESNEIIDNQISFNRDSDWIEENVLSKQRLVITSCQNNTEVDQDFLNALYCYINLNDANLIVIPVKYKTSQDEIDSYPEELNPFMVDSNIEIPKYKLKIYAGLKISPTASNPLSGIDTLSRGNSIIVGHPQVQLRTLPNLEYRHADIISTTGSISVPNYSVSKIGEKAKQNHSMSAIVIEFDKETFHLRHLNYDPIGKSFIDLDTEYHSDGNITDCVRVEAIVTGDEHAIYRDLNVEKYTYLDDDSIVNSLMPKYIVRHDTLDFASGSHHHKKNVFVQYAKYNSGMNSVEDEIRKTVEYINDTTPDFSQSLIVQSNHNEHLLRWLNEVEIKMEPWNAKVYHYLMYNMLEQTVMGENGTIHPDPFELISKPWLKPNVEFVSRKGRKILDIEIASHGDRGINGARGSAAGFSRLPDKMIVGHAHSPQILNGVYVVGTSSKLSLDYNIGASSWHHAHCIIHKNGTRQMIFINNDGWRLK